MSRPALLMTAMAGFAAGPAAAATGPFFSLHNTDFIVTLGFLLFVAILVYYRVPALVGGLLDKRAATIRAELDEARGLREEAARLLASYERKQKEVLAQSEEIVANARREALAAAGKAKDDLQDTIARRLRAAEDQIASAEASAIREVRDSAISVAVAAAGQLIAERMGAAEKAGLIDRAIDEVEARLH